MVRDNLCLDHFYIGFTKPEIQDLKKLCKVLSRCDYKKVYSGKEQWEGVYLHSNIGSYFEMILNPAEYGLGIACSAFPIQYVDSRKIALQMKHLPWQKNIRRWGKTSKIWFEWLALRALKEPNSYQPFFSWIMSYHLMHHADRKRPPQSSIDRFTSLEVKMNLDHIAYIKHHSKWLPGKIRIKKSSASLILHNRDSGDFNVDIELTNREINPTLKSLHMTLAPRVKVCKVDLRLFTLKRKRNELILSGKRS